MKEYSGLSDNQVKTNLAKWGNNKLSIKESQTFLEMFVESFKDKWILILIGALGIEMIFNSIKTLYPELGHSEWLNTVSIAVAILLSTGFATISSYRSEQKFSALQDEAGKIQVKTFRNGKLVEVLIDDLVVEDVILVQSGDKIPVDGYILEGQLKVNQASLNGESEDALKIELGGSELSETSDLFDEKRIFRGTVVTSGEAVIVATQIGDKTILGSINTSLQEDTKQSPSKEKLEKLANGIGVMGYSAGALYFIINIVLGYLALQTQANVVVFDYAILVMKTLMFAVTIVIMAVPEGLPMMLAMVASMNSGRLMKENILVRHSDSIETAGYTNILFSDKTGTITQGVLSVVDFIDGEGGVYDSISKLNETTKEHFINAMILNNDSFESEGKAIGSNGTDRALLQFAIDNNLKPSDTREIVEKEQFSSATKFSSITLYGGTKLIKGAPEVLIEKATYYLKGDGHHELTQQLKDKLNEVSLKQAERSMRLLGLAREVEGKLSLIGLVCIRDNLRQGMSDTIKELNSAGVQVVMVTGDRKETAIAIAKEAGILSKSTDIVLTHDELNRLTDLELKAKLPFLKVVSRALPNDKKRLVNIAQELGMVASMTGDGTNDAPALKSADVGFSMGDGSETAKEASDIVILNNSLTSIEKAILNGRTMTESVKKFIIFQLTVNVATILISIIGPVLGLYEPFTIVQILWINLIMDTLAALAFGGEPAIKEYLSNKPIGRSESLVTTYMKTHIGTSALFITIGVLSIYLNVGGILDWVVEGSENADATMRTFLFTFFIYAVLFNSLNTRSKDFNVLKYITLNPKFIYVMSTIAIIQSLIIQYGGAVFSTVAMDLTHFLVALVLASLIIPVDFIRKAIVNR